VRSSRSGRASIAVVGSVIVAALAIGGGCGQSAPWCPNVCALSDAPIDCPASCEALISSCPYDATVQELFTCIGNSGSFAIADRECVAEANVLAAECLPSTPTLVAHTVALSEDSGTSGDDAGIDAVGPSEDAPVSTGDSSPPDAGFDAPAIDATADAPTTGCEPMALCEPPGSTCVSSGTGPCGLDEDLQCAPSGTYFVVGYPCSEPFNEGFGCGGGGPGPQCSYNCSCAADGYAQCASSCDDAGR
jgi:hypothetical protein